MISRKQIADAYECCVITMRPILRSVGINHMKSITLSEFRLVIKKIGYPTNQDQKFKYLADLALHDENEKPVKESVQLSLFPGVANQNRFNYFPGIKQL